MKKNIKLLIAYDGTRFFGWQKTNTGPSIEEELEKALERLLQEKVSLQAASRTDRGVHAEGQVVNFFTEKDVGFLQRGLNAVLPQEIRVKLVEERDPSFHPTLHSTGKEYLYNLCSGNVQLPFHRTTSWHYPASLALAEMQKAAAQLIGTHDFSAFCNDNKLSTRTGICTLQAIKITPLEQQRFQFQIIGDNFLYKMVRNIVGTLVYVGAGKISNDAIAEILASRNRTAAGVTAPAHGLTLQRVLYLPLYSK